MEIVKGLLGKLRGTRISRSPMSECPLCLADSGHFPSCPNYQGK